ncbi:MAG: hypothetical protein RL274_2335 [Pseudomonadota bacterium]|jgi:ribosomal 50S subunit-recycling heat shock protein
MSRLLFHARFCRTQALAQAEAAAGRVRLNGRGWRIPPRH